MSKNKGFTLIELLIVILIISILSGLTLSVINTSGLRGKTRDAQRKSDLQKVQTALELYYSDRREYPTATQWTAVHTGLVTSLVGGKYIGTLPQDPEAYGSVFECNAGDASEFSYSYKTHDGACAIDCDASKYVLVASMEVASSANDNKCSDLSNWNTISGCGGTAPVNCYGIQNP